MRKRIVALAGVIAVALVAGACSDESTPVTTSSVPVAGVNVEAQLRLEGDMLLIAYQVANRSPSTVLAVTDIDRSYVRIGEDGVVEFGRALRSPIEGIAPPAVPRADMTAIPK